MNAIDQLFARYRSEGKKALLPFVTAGDPDLEFTSQIVQELSRRGCAICELGVPYSDPIADGPVIQASYTRALQKHVSVAGILEMVQGLHTRIEMPLVTMVSYAIVHRIGPERYVDQARQAGISGAIIPDLLVDESEGMARICRERDFSLIQLVTPTTPRERAVRIAETSSGFLYYVSVVGITGERRELPAELLDSVAWLREQTPLPLCIGFGISGPDQVRQLAGVADGLIVGSALVRRIATAAERPRQQVIAEVGEFAAELLAALNGG